MRILQVCQPSDGGVAHHVLTLSTELMARGWEVDVACSPGTLANELKQRGITVFLLPLVREVAGPKDIASVFELIKMIRKGAYSLVHMHSAKAGAVGRVASVTSRAPAIYTPHAWSFLSPESRLEKLVYVGIEQILALFTRRIICVSLDELRLGRLMIGVGGKLRLVHNGVVVPEVHRRTEEKELRIGTIARLARQKGIEYLIQAAEEVCAENETVRFSVAGGGPDYERLRSEIKRSGLGDRFELIGPVSEPWGYLEQLDIFVLPSLWEGMPFVLLEAMGAGLPVVATDVGGVREVIPDGTFGTVVPPADAGELKDAILQYASSTELRESTGAAARERILREFSRDRMVEATIQVYTEVAG